jgi:hypothetical protein
MKQKNTISRQRFLIEICFLLCLIAFFSSCGSSKESSNNSNSTKVEIRGYVGIRPLPRTAKEASTDWVKGISKIGNYDEQLKANSFAAKYTDMVFEYTGNFKTRKTFFEYYLPFDKDWDDSIPSQNKLIKRIHDDEAQGMDIHHIIICRESELVGKGKWGPIKEDSRILYQRDVDNYRKLFKEAYALKMIRHDNYKLIQLLHSTHAFCDNPEARKIVKTMDGVAYECHQFGSCWPWETGITRPKELARGAKWALRHGMDYVFYYGPFVYKEYKGYYPFVERDWLYKYWAAGLPKHHPHLYYYLNDFPFAHGASRQVGPESDPNSYLGMLDWLIKEIKGENPQY